MINSCVTCGMEIQNKEIKLHVHVHVFFFSFLFNKIFYDFIACILLAHQSFAQVSYLDLILSVVHLRKMFVIATSTSRNTVVMSSWDHH